MSAVNLARKLAISSVSVVLIFLAAEIAARMSEPGPMSWYDTRPYVKVGNLKHEHIANFAGRWDGTWYATNSKGMRGPEFEPTFEEDEFRVVAIGDSCTFGKGVLEADCWPRQLERLLQAEMPHRRVMVANLGVNGYSATNYERVLVTKGIVERPHLVVVGFNINDFPNITQRVDQEVFQGKKTLRSRIPSDMRDRLGETALFRWLRATYYELRREQDWKAMERLAAKAAESFDPVNSDGLGPELIRSIVQSAQDSGAQIAAFLFPYESMIYLDDYNRTPSKRIHAVADPLGVPFIDIAEAFRDVAHQTSPPRRLFIRGDRYHPNAEGYEIVARSVFGAVKDRGWLEPPQ